MKKIVVPPPGTLAHYDPHYHHHHHELFYCKKSFEILREKCASQRNKNLTPKLREKCDGNYAIERSLCAICKRRPRKRKEIERKMQRQLCDRA